MKTTFINSSVAEYTDSEFSWLQSDVMESGYFALQDGTKTFQITQKTVPSLGIDISAGKILLPYAKAGISWKLIVESNAVQSFSITPNSSGANRVDAVIVKLDITNEPDVLKTNIASVQVIQGTGTSPLTDGAIQTIIGAGYVFTRLANITVPTGATTILDINIANLLPKVKISKAVNVDADSVISIVGSASANDITATVPVSIADKAPVSLIYKTTYKTNDTVNAFEVVGNSANLAYDTIPNQRGGIYTLQGYDYKFFLNATVLYYAKKLTGTDPVASTWATPVSTGVQVFNNLDANWTIGCDEKNNTFHLVYNKNAGSSDGKLYYRMLTVPVGGVISVGSEVVAWTDTLFTFIPSTSDWRGLDSEFVNDAYYVIFQNKDAGGNYKATLIANTASDGTWAMKSGMPIDMDSTFGEYHNGCGCSLGGIGGGRIGLLWYKRTAVTGVFPSYIYGYPAYREYNTITGATTANEQIPWNFSGSPSYDFDMQFGNNSVSFQDETVYIGIQAYDTSGTGARPYKTYKKVSFNTWDLLSFVGSGTTNTGLGFSTIGNRLFYAYTYNYSGGGASQAIRIDDSTDGWCIRNQIYVNQSNNYAKACIMRAVQNGKGIQNAFGYIFRQGTGEEIWYTRNTILTTPYLETTNFLSADSRSQFIGFAKGNIIAGGSGTAVVSGNFITGDTDIIPNKKYYIGYGGITPHGQTNGIYIGVGSSNVSINLDIDNTEDLSTTTYNDIRGSFKVGYDGIIKHQITDTNGGGSTQRDVYIPVKAGDSFAGVSYRRLQK